MSAIPAGTLVLTRSQVAKLLDLDTCIEVVERAFQAHGEGRVPDPGIMGVHVPSGGFHTKGGLIELDRPYFAAKTNANFMHNRTRFGLPTIQGTIVLHDAETGFPLALMDSIEISILRTGAATAVAAKYLARAESATVAVAGCGAQGRVQLRAVARVRPVERAFVWDLDPDRAEELAAEMAAELGFDVRSVDTFPQAVHAADICITCTPSEEYLLHAEQVRAGTFVAGVGVDNPHKKELHPGLLSASTVVVDMLDQCATIGDLHHALEAGVIGRSHVQANLGSIVAGRAPGRTHPGETIVFDSTGMAVQDVAAAATVYQRAMGAGVGRMIDLGG